MTHDEQGGANQVTAFADVEHKQPGIIASQVMPICCDHLVHAMTQSWLLASSQRAKAALKDCQFLQTIQSSVQYCEILLHGVAIVTARQRPAEDPLRNPVVPDKRHDSVACVVRIGRLQAWHTCLPTSRGRFTSAIAAGPSRRQGCLQRPSSPTWAVHPATETCAETSGELREEVSLNLITQEHQRCCSLGVLPLTAFPSTDVVKKTP